MESSSRRIKKSVKRSVYFTDGSYFPKLDLGAYAVVVAEFKNNSYYFKDVQKSGICRNTNPVSMEFEAVIRAMKDGIAKHKKHITIFCDCKVVVDTLININHLHNHNYTKNGYPLIYEDYTKILYPLSKQIDYQIHHIYSHGKDASLHPDIHEFNDLADKCARGICIRYMNYLVNKYKTPRNNRLADSSGTTLTQPRSSAKSLTLSIEYRPHSLKY